MFVLNMHTKEKHPFLEKSAINNFSQIDHTESNSTLDSRNKCLQLVSYLKWGLVHKLKCRVPFDQDEIFLLELQQIKQIFFLH